MQKKSFVFALVIIISFISGYYTSLLFSQQKGSQKSDLFGTYVHDFSTISINHNSTYQFTSPFTEGKIITIDESTCKLKDGDLNGFILIFSENSLKLIDTENDTVKEFSKSTSSESQLKESN